MENRRDFLKKAAMLSGGAGLINMLPPSVQKALAINPAPGSTWQDAEHVVLLMQENRSFDHCFGSLRGVRGFNDPRVLQQPNKNSVWLQTNKAGETFAPFRLNIKDTKATWMSSLPHSWANQVDARNGGKFNQWLDAKKPGKPYEKIPMTMGYYTREDIPFYYAMADAFTVCDQHFCSSLTGTTPNRLYFWTGKLREDATAKARVRNADTDYGTAEAGWKTFPERLEEAQISWKIYQNELSVGVGFEGEEDAWLGNFTDNPIEWFSQYHVKLSKGYIAFLQKAASIYQPKIKALKEKLKGASGTDKTQLQKELAGLKAIAEQLKKEQKIYTTEKYNQLSAIEKNIHDKAFTTNSNDPDFHKLDTISYAHEGKEEKIAVPKGDVLHQFRTDVKNGELPVVSWLVAPENFSDHPTSPWYGAWYVSEVMDILTQNPEVWKKTIFIITYDENDGCFDHVPPFVPPHPLQTNSGIASAGIDTADEFVTMEQELKEHTKEEAREGPIGLGYRVPLIIASPWSRGGWVCSEVFDHTSSLQFLEQFINIKSKQKVAETNISKWRRTVCGDLTSTFRPYKGEQIDLPVALEKDAFITMVHQSKFKNVPDNFKNLTQQEIALINKNPGDSPYMPQQEKGIRPACALPYELYADGNINAAKNQFSIDLKAGNTLISNAAGAPFTIYAMGNYLQADKKGYEPLHNRSYALAPGTNVSDQWLIPNFEHQQYCLSVYGPNGFYRLFRGDANDADIDIKCLYQTANGNKPGDSLHVAFAISNNGNTVLKLLVKDNAYKNADRNIVLQAKSQHLSALDVNASHGWYDFSITIEGNNGFEKRYAGHIENGKPSFTDPLMGQVV
ncbi:phosphocholine-specific phospholipase C [Limnovirga soli]|uniref:phospholipase C n=1 Tax=Limnovirga soli TaxID=2656915 RepID=A0A8J8FCQ0_9BACT|nr:phospholipase C, phosphocholine-specific [Limnovirga soli]NNV55330.1 phospholipase C, phosphocholine-specific [Limnovirga soli]